VKTTVLSSTNAEDRRGAADRRASGRHAVQLIVTLAVNVALLAGGVWLTGVAWRDLCFLLLPPMVASAGAGVAFLVLNRMALQSLVPAAAKLPAGHAHVALDR
jgi:hypothetical protein